MQYKETGFRPLYHGFTAFMLKDNLKTIIKDFPGADQANCILTYGYIDTEAGLTLEVLAAGESSDKGFRFFDTNTEIRAFIRIGAVEDDEFFCFRDEDGDFSGRYGEKIAALESYAASEGVEKTRDMAFLDSSRDSNCVDDVLVFLLRDGLKPEGCWVRITDLAEHWFMGTLLNEPDQNFGYHVGEQIAFFVHKQEDGSLICCSDMNPSRRLTAADLEDGSLLKQAVSTFNKERTQDNFTEIMELLRDSYVWIPCNAVLSERDQAEMLKMLDETNGDPDSLIGKTVCNQDNIRMIPDVLINGEHMFFPVFSSAEEMGEYGEGFSKIQKHFLEAISLARNNPKGVSGIVLNAFTEPFVLDKGLFDVVENLTTRIV